MREQMTTAGMLVLGAGIVLFWIAIGAAIHVHAGRRRDDVSATGGAA